MNIFAFVNHVGSNRVFQHNNLVSRSSKLWRGATNCQNSCSKSGNSRANIFSPKIRQMHPKISGKKISLRNFFILEDSNIQYQVIHGRARHCPKEAPSFKTVFPEAAKYRHSTLSQMWQNTTKCSR